MGPLNLLLLAAGIVLVAVGYRRGRGPWRRYRSMQATQANIQRYEQWRGGVRGGSETTGADVMRSMLRRQAQVGGLMVAIGAVLVFLGFFLG